MEISEYFPMPNSYLFTTDICLFIYLFIYLFVQEVPLLEGKLHFRIWHNLRQKIE